MFSVSNDGVVELRSALPRRADVGSDVLRLTLSVCLPLGGLALIPFALLAVRDLWKYDCCKKHRGGSNASTFIGLHSLDFFALYHPVNEGRSPVMHSTCFGGAMSVLAIGTVAVLGVALVIDYSFSNTLSSTALLPADLPTLQDLADVPVYSAEASALATLAGFALPTAGLPAYYASGEQSGIQIRVKSQGSNCGSPIYYMTAPTILGNFSYAVVPENATASYEHIFFCQQCAFGRYSSMSVTFPPSCQSLRLLVFLVGARGSVSAASAVLSSEPPSSMHTSATFNIEPQLEVVNDTTRAYLVRGYVLGSTSLSTVSSATPPSMTLHLNFGTSTTYSRVTAVFIRTPYQLLSSLIGITGIVGGFGVLFQVQKQLCSRRSRIIRASSRKLTALSSPRPAALHDDIVVDTG